jgi:2-C-methyl-D-erythritol 4-phosphate cytidylyltransferase
MPEYWGLIPAAGTGKRMKSGLPKQYIEILGRTVLEHTICRLLGCPSIRSVMVCIAPDDSRWPDLKLADSRLLPAVEGGRKRADSVLNGLLALEKVARPDDWVLVHDAARPCLSHHTLERLLTEAGEDEVGGILALPVSDTVKRGDKNNRIVTTEMREGLWRAQTPQMFRLGVLRRAIESGLTNGEYITDEASAMELAGYSPKLIVGEPGNIKITLPEDLALAEVLLDGIL